MATSACEAAAVYPAFEEMVQHSLFKKRSASFYRKPAGIELRHVGFLGAQPPDVKGLADMKFEEGFETAEVVFEEETMSDATRIFMSLTPGSTRCSPGARRPSRPASVKMRRRS